MRVLLLCTDVETRNYYVTLAIADALRAHEAIEFVFVATHGDALTSLTEKECDTFIAVGGAGHQHALLSRLCRAARVSALWTTEDPYDLSTNVKNSSCFTHVFTNDENSSSDYGGHASPLALGASELFHDHPIRLDDRDYQYDLCFVGTAWPNRVRALREVLEPFGRGLTTKIGLSRNEFLPAPELPDSDQELDWRCSNVEFAKICNSSRITLTLERDFTSCVGSRSTALTPPPRVFEAALAGGFQVFLTRQPWSDCYFEADDEIAVCRSTAEAVKAIQRALINPAGRIASAIAAQKTARQRHLYRHRVCKIIDRLSESPRHRVLIAKASRPRNLLFVTHNRQGGLPGGGVEVYQEELRRLPGGFIPFYLVPEGDKDDQRYILHLPDGSTFSYRLPTPVHSNSLTDPAAEQAFGTILVNYNIDLVHFQHLLGFPLSLPLIASAMGVQTVFTVHDYFLVCNRFNLIDYTGRFCNIASKSKSNCDICLNATEGLPSGSQARRAAFVARIIRSFGAVIANTAYSASYICSMYPELDTSSVRIIEMLLPKATFAPKQLKLKTEGMPLQVVVPGNFTEGKGAHQVVRLMNNMRDDNVSFSVLGYVHPDFESILLALDMPKVSRIGSYAARDASRLMAAFDVSLHLSIWPETYMITLNEAWAAGVVPIASALGAPADRIISGVNGFLVDPWDIGAIVDLLRSLVADRSRLSSMALAARPPQTPSKHLSELADVYTSLLSKSPVLDFLANKPEVRVDAWVAGIRTNYPRWDCLDNKWDDACCAPTFGSRVTYSDRLPSGVGAQRQMILAGKDTLEGSVFIDSLLADGVESRGVSVSATMTLAIRGWAFAPGYGRLNLAFVRLLPREGQSVVVQLPPSRRPDVAAALSDEFAAEAGFDTSIDVRNLEAGPYDLDLVQSYADICVVFSGIADAVIVDCPSVLGNAVAKIEETLTQTAS